MSEMVERVARALAREDVIAAIAQGDEQTRGHSAIEVAVAGMKAESRLWSSYTKQARAAIAAIREPTQGMYVAGMDAPQTVTCIWEAMIDKAIKP